MRILIVTIVLEHVFDRTPDGVWTKSAFGSAFWERYLRVFDGVQVVARVRNVARLPDGYSRVDGPRVSFAGVFPYDGPREFVFRARTVYGQVSAALDAQRGAVILRVPGTLGSIAFAHLRRSTRPYAVEVVGDPQTVFGPGAMKVRAASMFRWGFSRELRRQCWHAVASAYVTATALQSRYPPAPGAMTVGCSDVVLQDGAFRYSPRAPREAGQSFELVTVGSLAQMYKGPDVLIDALARLQVCGFDGRLTFIGSGRHLPDLEALVRYRGLTGRVRFLGELPAGDAVWHELDKAHLFVLPSRTEGLPRALIEAMARGLPCVGTRVGGIPELLDEEDLVPPNDAAALAAKLREVFDAPQRLERMAARNLARARHYDEAELAQRRARFLQTVRMRTYDWSVAQARP